MWSAWRLAANRILGSTGFSSHVFVLLLKMLQAKQMISRAGRECIFDSGEVDFLLRLLGAEAPIDVAEEARDVDLWIPED